MRIVCISDTHGRHRQVHMPPGDVLIFAGDMVRYSIIEEIEAFDNYLSELPHKHKIVVAGNHDWPFQKQPEEARAQLKHTVYLEDSEITIDGIRIYGSPWQPWFCDWAFNLERGAEIKAKWDLIPDGIDILVTHGPPLHHGDRVARGEQGCEDLLDAVRRVKPKYHIFGHIHEGYGETREGTTVCLNVSSCNRTLAPVNPPIVFDIEACGDE